MIRGPQSPTLAPVPSKEPTDQKVRDPKVLKAAQMYETQFLREMVRAMRKTVNESDLIKTNMAEKIFREQLDDEYVEQWVNVRGGIGLSNLIHDQIVERYGNMLGLTKANLPPKAKGPINLNKSMDMKVKNLKPTGSNQMSIRIEAPGEEIHSPWSGKVLESFKTPEGLQVVKLAHENDLFSLLSFAGEVSDLPQGKSVNAGDVVGITSSQKPWIDLQISQNQTVQPT